MNQKLRKFVSLITVVAIICTLFTASFGTVSAYDKVNTEGKRAAASVTYDFGLPANSKGGVILHAWNWYFNDVTERMEEIARAGYKTVQISPVQLSKEDGEYLDTKNNWWKLYQPLNFSVGNFLGTKAEFSKMCQTAHKYGVKIIVDVVTNQMAGGNAGANKDCSNEINLTVSYNGKTGNIIDFAGLWHDPTLKSSDSSRQNMVQGSIGMPDLNTSSSVVQELVLGLLKECVDLGADGFRYDALKHIETDIETESDLSSNFWKNTTLKVDEYANKDLYHYGEVIAPVHPNDTQSANLLNNGYLKYFDGLTDVATGYWLREDIKLNKIDQLADGLLCGIRWQGFKNASDLVLWVESHDTYAEDTYKESQYQNENPNNYGVLTSKPLSDNDIKLGWSIINSRASVSTLFFVRPIAFSQAQSTYFGADGSSTLYLDKDIVAVNQFHNYFYGYNTETVTAVKDSTIYSVERNNTKTNTAGIVVTNIGTTAASGAKTKNFANGNYTDVISGKSYTVSNGTISGTIPAKSFIILYSKNVANHAEPKATISQEGGQFEDSLDLTLGLVNANKGTYRIGDGAPVEFTNGTEITIGENAAAGEYVAVTISASNANKTSDEKTYVFTKCDPVQESPVVYFIYTGTQSSLPSSVKFNFDDIIKAIGGTKTQTVTAHTDIPATVDLNTRGFDLGINYVRSKYKSNEIHRVFQCPIPSGYEHGKVSFEVGTKRIPAQRIVTLNDAPATADFNLYNKPMVCFDYRKGYGQPEEEDYNLVIKSSYSANISATNGGSITNEYVYEPFDSNTPGQTINYNTNRKQFLLGSIIRSTAYEGDKDFSGWYNADTDELITTARSIILPVYQDVNIEARFGSSFAPGDIDGDNMYTLLDAYMIYSYINDSENSTLTSEQIAAVDVNGDGNINTNDVQAMLNDLSEADEILDSAKLTIVVDKDTDGTVSGAVSGKYVANTSITVTGTPKKAHYGVTWKIGNNEVGNNSTYTFIITEDTTLTAKFTELPKYHVTINAGEHGDIDSEYDDDVYADDGVHVEATADTGYHFIGWYDNNNEEFLDGQDETLDIDYLTEDIDLTAQFSDEYTVTVISPEEGGIIEINAPANLELDEPTKLKAGTEVTLEAVADNGYNFVGWYDSNDEELETTEEYTFEVEEDIEVTAKFETAGKIVYFYNSLGYTTPYCHVWETGGATLNEWGADSAKMTLEISNYKGTGKAVYAFMLPANSHFDNVIFYDYDKTKGASNAQTSTLTTFGGDKTEKNNMYVPSQNKWIPYGSEIPTPSIDNYVYFSTNWTNVHIYAWRNSPYKEMTSWDSAPKMTYVGKNDIQQSIFKYELPEEYDMIIFKDESNNQTVNIPRSTEHNGYYVADSSPYYGYYDFDPSYIVSQ